VQVTELRTTLGEESLSMDSWPLALTPLVLLVLLSVIRFVGCKFDSSGTGTGPPPGLATYGDVVLADPNLVSFWRLGEPAGTAAGATAVDEKAAHDGTYRTFNLPANAALMSPATAHPPTLAAGQGSLVFPQTSVRVDGGYVEVGFAAALNPPQFTIEAIVLPEWNPAETGVFRCVLASREETTVAPIRRHGYILYAGPTLDPVTAVIVDPTVRWQVWVGTGANNALWQWLVGPAVEAGPTYLAATCDGATLKLFVANEQMDLDTPGVQMGVTYSPNPGKPLYIGMGAPDRAVPVPGPLYPFKGRLQEVAVYDAVLPDEAFFSRLVAASLT
jgi:hypothetical protein